MNNEAFSSRTKKITVRCVTCGITESFFSPISVNHFSLSHPGHNVMEVKDSKSPETPEAARSIGENPLSGDGHGISLPKVVVEFVTTGESQEPVFRISGFKEDMSDAFVEDLDFDEGPKVREIVAKGEYSDRRGTGQLYTWEPEAVEYVREAREALRLPNLSTQHKEEIPRPEPPVVPAEGMYADFLAAPRLEGEPEILHPSPEPMPLKVQAPELEVELEVEREQELEPEREPPAKVEEETASPPEPEQVLETEHKRPANVAEEVTSPPEQEQVLEPKEEAPAKVEEEEPSQPDVHETKAVQTTPVETQPPSEVHETKMVHAPPRETPPPKEKDDYLLVSKSWYIEEGSEKMREAVRISRSLRQFRWRVEPAYTIGVMLDDILSIETVKGEIGGELTKSIEKQGYTLSAVTADQGKLVAWFKRKPGFEIPTLPDSTEAFRLRTEVADLNKSIEEERKKADEQRQAWEARYTRLLDLLKEAGAHG